MSENHKPAQELGIGDVLSETFSVYGEGFVKFLAVYLVVELVLAFVNRAVTSTYVIPQVPVNATSQELLSTWFPQVVDNLVPLLVFTLLATWIFATVALGVAVKMASQYMEGGGVGLGSSLGSVARRLPSLWALSFVVGACVFLATMALVVPGIIVAIMFSLTVPAFVVQGIGVSGSLSRSRELVGERWLKTFALGLVLVIMIGVASIVVNLVAGAFGDWSSVASSLLSSLYMPLIPIGLTVYYYSNVARTTPPPAPDYAAYQIPPPAGPGAPLGQQPAALSPLGYCPACGTAVADVGQSFCRRCGRNLRTV
jgi:hypothetical protein